MDFFNALIKRQQGTYMIQDYDYALSQLKCNKSDVYRGFGQSAEDDGLIGVDTPIFASKFCPQKNHHDLLALANEDGYIALQSTDKSKQFVSKHGHFNAIFDLAWMPGDLYIITAAGDHSVILWDMHESDIREVSRFDAHTRSVKTAVFRQEDNAVFATGARDGAVMIWDIRANHSDTPDNIIGNAHGGCYPKSKTRKYCPASRVQSITGLAFQDDFTLLSCAAGDGLIKVWDLRKNYTVHKKDPVAKHCLQHAGLSMRNGFTSLLMCPSGVTLYASCMNNIIYAYNVGTYDPKPFAEYYGHENNTFYVKSCLSPDGKYIASGSSDEAAYIWKTSQPGNPIVRLNGHRAEVATVAWSHEYDTKLVTCSDDATHRIWRIGEVNDYDDEPNDIRGYATWIKNRICKNKKDVGEVQMQTPTTDFSMSADESTPMSGISSTSNNPGSANSTASNKRTYEQMNKNILSPIHENREYKRPHLEIRSARRLFSPTNEPSSSKNYELEEPSFRSPTKVGNENQKTMFSPTVNLPNFVIDGTAPHLLERSPIKCQNENVDWLTKFRKQIQEQTAEKTRLAKTPGRRRSTSAEPRSPSTSLLKYFKVQLKDASKSPQPSTSKDMSENC